MSDSSLRELEAASLASPDDELLRYRFRVECVRLGLLDRAGLETGDIVSVVEAETGSTPPPAIHGTWIGVLELRSTRYGKGSHEHRAEGRYLAFVVHPLQPDAAEWATKIIDSAREPEGGAPVHVMKGDLVSLLEPMRPGFLARPHHFPGYTDVVRVTPEGLKITTCCCSAAGAPRRKCADTRKHGPTKNPCRCYCHSLKVAKPREEAPDAVR